MHQPMGVTQVALSLDVGGLERTRNANVRTSSMQEPYLSRFCNLIRRGAAKQDIHDTVTPVGYARSGAGASEAFVNREVHRVAAHQDRLVPLLEHYVGRAASILDVGCGTGGTTVALALSRKLQPEKVIGIDPNQLSIEAAEVRVQGYGLSPERVRVECIAPGVSLPFSEGQFSLTVCVSVLEFISTDQGREFLASELLRVTEPGGFIFLATPSPFRLRETHSRRFLGNFRRHEGFPWSSTPWRIRRMFRSCTGQALHGFIIRDITSRFRIPAGRLLFPVSGLLGWMLPWQKFLFRKSK
jgi:SAM-dependent methyltransferase